MWYDRLCSYTLEIVKLILECFNMTSLEINHHSMCCSLTGNVSGGSDNNRILWSRLDTFRIRATKPGKHCSNIWSTLLTVPLFSLDLNCLRVESLKSISMNKEFFSSFVTTCLDTSSNPSGKRSNVVTLRGSQSSDIAGIPLVNLTPKSVSKRRYNSRMLWSYVDIKTSWGERETGRPSTPELRRVTLRDQQENILRIAVWPSTAFGNQQRFQASEDLRDDWFRTPECMEYVYTRG